jgi:PAS domain S-box-containing protein
MQTSMADGDPNLRFAVLALARGLIDERQFISACESWSAKRHATIAELLVERGWISDVERASLETLAAHERADENPTMTLTPRNSLTGLIDSLDLGDAPMTMRERITLRHLHSSGGIGEVWRAYDEVLGREVALKWLKREQASHLDNRARFQREAQITGQLDHPGVVPVYDYSTTDDGTRCFYTMRFLRGRTLADVIDDFHRTRGDDSMVSGPFLQLLGYFVSICNTMAFAHSRGIVHRDLKGDNVIVGKFGEVIVLDWGLAKRIGADEPDPQGMGEAHGSPVWQPSNSGEGRIIATMQGERLGTPAFMAPEQARGSIDEIDERTDVYGLAAILYNILTGRPPFYGEDIVAVMDAVVREQPTPPSEVVPGVPLELERICLLGLAKTREQRWQSVTELAAAVQGWVTALAERTRTEQEREHFFDLSLDLLAIIDRGGRVRQSNAAWSSHLGWSEQERADTELLEFIAPEHRELVEARLGELWAGAAVVELEVRMLRADGKLRWVDLRARTMPDEAAIYVVGRDVTERRQSEQQFIGLLESAPDATCVIDESGTIVLVNKQLERMFGYPRERLIGQPIEILVPEHLRGGHLQHVRRYVNNPNPRPMGSGLALTGQREDGVIIPIEVSLSPVQTETRLLVSCALRIRRSPSSPAGS